MEEIVTRRILPTCWTRQIIETRFGFAPPAITKSRFIGRCSIEVFTTLREPCSKVEVVPTSQLRAFSGIKIPLTNKELRALPPTPRLRRAEKPSHIRVYSRPLAVEWVAVSLSN